MPVRRWELHGPPRCQASGGTSRRSGGSGSALRSSDAAGWEMASRPGPTPRDPRHPDPRLRDSRYRPVNHVRGGRLCRDGGDRP